MAIQNNFPAIKPSLNLDFATSKTLDPRITFTRASTATYYDGKTVAKAEENLIKYSQAVGGTSWSNAAGASTLNSVVAPDGTTTASTFTLTSGSAVHAVLPTDTFLATSPVTFSVYLKLGTHNYWSLLFKTGTQYVAAVINISTGAITQTNTGTSSTYTSSTITSVGSGWYRVTLTGSLLSGALANFQINSNSSATPTLGSDGNETWTASGTETVFIWGAQLEQRSSVTAYTATTTQPITNYIPALQTALSGVPRFDHDPITGESLGLLVEEQRANLLTYSADLTNAAWLKTAASVTGDAVIAPDGTLTADLLIEDTATSEHRVRVINVTKSASAVMTLSVYVKPSGRYMILALEFGGAGLYTTFDVLSTQYWDFAADTGWTRGQTVITPVGNGWYRCSISGTTSTDLSVTARVHLTNATGLQKNTSYTGNGKSGIYLWGAQLEVGAFPASYIPTVASQVTRSTDAVSMTGTNFSSWYRVDEGTFNVEAAARQIPTTGNTVVNLYNTSNGDYLNTSIAFANTQKMRCSISGGYDTGATGPSYTVGVNYKIAFALKPYAHNVYFSGVEDSITISSPLMPGAGANAMNIGALYYLGNAMNGTIKRITYYPKRLSNTELQSITS